MLKQIALEAGITLKELREWNEKRGKTKIELAARVCGFDKTIKVTDDMSEATFTVPLKKGACDVHAQFVGDDGKAYGAYFLYVKHEGQRKQQ